MGVFTISGLTTRDNSSQSFQKEWFRIFVLPINIGVNCWIKYQMQDDDDQRLVSIGGSNIGGIGGERNRKQRIPVNSITS